jgi:hypothetical protein
MVDASAETAASDYSVFGLRVRSTLPLPELFPADGAGEPDVFISFADVPEGADAPAALSACNGALVLVIPGVARYRISGGQSITVQPDAGVPERNVRLYLLGSAFGALLHQRGLLPLHANAIEIGGKAVAFMGESGAGKSTLAAAFEQLGHGVIADDVCVVGFDPAGSPFAAPGVPRLRLWAEALQHTGRGTEGFERSYAGDEEFDKFDVPLDPGSAVRAKVPLAALYLLARRDEFSVEPLVGIEAAEALFANTYRGSFLAAAKGLESHWLSSVRLVRSVPVFRASRPWNGSRLQEQCQLLVDHAAQLTGTGLSSADSGK